MTRLKTARGRKASSTRWLERQLNDPYVKRAKADGYRSRAAYKLLELDEKFGLLRGVTAVIDLGIAPGGWSQVVSRLVPGARIAGIDLLPTDPIDGKDRLAAYARMKARATDSFSRFAEMLPSKAPGIRLLGTSGTVTTLASVHLALPSYDRRAVDGLHMPTGDMRRISTMIAELDFGGRSNLPCIGAERADLVVAGCAILEAILDIWPAENLGVADRGIREGILRSLMARDGHVL